MRINKYFQCLAVLTLILGFAQFSHAIPQGPGDCYIQLQCPNDSTIVSCSGETSSCHVGSDYVSCNGQRHECPVIIVDPEPCVAPPVMDIVESIPTYYPPMHPYGRYYLSGNSVDDYSYAWSVNYGEILSGSTSGSAVIKSHSLGWFTITITATSKVPGCTKTTQFSENFYVDEDFRAIK
ncbi:hypothetical protein ACJJIG_17765 [Microbulbifer sp. SSSA007]|uniref:hypothetical protein n=1 Tax=Microbulbifer sp. SSSA007 TaxID=3243379 RepID=UPI0040391DFC